MMATIIATMRQRHMLICVTDMRDQKYGQYAIEQRRSGSVPTRKTISAQGNNRISEAGSRAMEYLLHQNVQEHAARYSQDQGKQPIVLFFSYQKDSEQQCKNTHSQCALQVGYDEHELGKQQGRGA